MRPRSSQTEPYTNLESEMATNRREFMKACAATASALGMSCTTHTAAVAAGWRESRMGHLVHKVRQAASQSPVTPNPATPVTAAVNAALLDQLPFDDRQDYEDAARGLIAELPENGFVPLLPDIPAWNLAAYDFLAEDAAPPEVNPSLWRQAQINMNNGLFQVVDGIYQVRGADMSNLTVIEGKKGIILIDPLVTVEAARAALALYQQQRGPREVVAVIYSHSHTDHYGGVRGVVDEADVRAGRVEIIAPDRFMEKVISENVFAGTAMTRRSTYSYGHFLPRGIHGQVDAGLGKATSVGTISLIAPTDTIVKTGERRRIDGVEIIFQMTPDTEAPAEMMMHYPGLRVLNSAELACSLLHNIYTPRGAEVRDATMWAYYLNEAIDLFGAETDVLIAQHNWPTWGSAQAIEFLKQQRDLYKYLHDQTLHLANQGLTMTEIAEELARKQGLPASLGQQWHNRGYYGTVSHNVKAIYQKYLGWYDCNPAHLEPLPPSEAGKRYVTFMGGADNVIEQAQATFDQAQDADDYRWVAEVMSHVVFADPTNREARQLGADALEQLGYQAESAIWRNHYLMGASELRNGLLSMGGAGTANADTVRAMPIGSFFDYLGIRLNAAKADGKHIVINWTFTDLGETYTLNLENSALTYRPNRLDDAANAHLTLTKAALDAVNMAPDPAQALADALKGGDIGVTGDPRTLAELFGLLDVFTTKFNIIEP